MFGIGGRGVSMGSEAVERLLAFLNHRHGLAAAGHLHAPYRTETILLGVRLGAAAMLGIDVSEISPIWSKVVEERGWQPEGKWLHKQIQDSGFDSARGAAELVAIEIEVWKRLAMRIKTAGN